MSYEIKLDIFEGPLDLLLYLIRKNEIDIYNIPIALITEQYLEYLDMMRSLNLDLAGEYLVLAATLIHIKSRLLLPPVEGEEEERKEKTPVRNWSGSFWSIRPSRKRRSAWKPAPFSIGMSLRGARPRKSLPRRRKRKRR